MRFSNLRPSSFFYSPIFFLFPLIQTSSFSHGGFLYPGHFGTSADGVVSTGRTHKSTWNMHVGSGFQSSQVARLGPERPSYARTCGQSATPGIRQCDAGSHAWMLANNALPGGADPRVLGVKKLKKRERELEL